MLVKRIIDVLVKNHVLQQNITVVMVLYKIVLRANELHLIEMLKRLVMVVQEVSYMIVVYTMAAIISVVL